MSPVPPSVRATVAPSARCEDFQNPKARYALAKKSTVAKTGDKSATESTVDSVADLSPVYRKSIVAGSFDFVDRVAVNTVIKVKHVQLGRLCRKWVIFVARMSNVLSTLSPVCTGLKALAPLGRRRCHLLDVCS